MLAYALALALLLVLTLSPPGLFALGIPYDVPFGNPLAKLHPGTWVMLLAYGVALLAVIHRACRNARAALTG